MAVIWRLKTYLAREQNIFKARALQVKIIKETGIKISLQNLACLMREKPSMIRLKTMEVICTALKCKLSDFCNVSEGKIFEHKVVKQLSAQNTPHCLRAKSEFPDPNRYE